MLMLLCLLCFLKFTIEELGIFFPLETNKISRKTSKILIKKKRSEICKSSDRAQRETQHFFFLALFIRYAPPTTALHVFGDSQCPTKYVTFIIHMSLIDLCQRSVVRLHWSPAPWWFTSELKTVWSVGSSEATSVCESAVCFSDDSLTDATKNTFHVFKNWY